MKCIPVGINSKGFINCVGKVPKRVADKRRYVDHLKVGVECALFHKPLQSIARHLLGVGKAGGGRWRVLARLGEDENGRIAKKKQNIGPIPVVAVTELLVLKPADIKAKFLIDKT